jgi:predicted alpha-1,2-mannosidase
MSRNEIAFVLLAAFVSGGCKTETGSDSAMGLTSVDPAIGGVGLILQPTRPTVHLPNSLIRSYPVKADQLDDQIQYFPLTVSSHRVASVFSFMPIAGSLDGDVWNRRVGYESEEATPYCYRAHLEEPGDSVAFTPAARSGYFRVTFDGAREHYLRLGLINKGGDIQVKGPRVITGVEQFQGMRAFLYAETDADMTEVRLPGSSGGRGVLLKTASDALQVEFRYGISYISVEQAKQNLANEIPVWDFGAVKNKARQAWLDALSQIRVKGGTPAQRRVFYTALYRCYERPVDINEYGRYFSAYDGKVHASDAPFYVDNWLWDTHIALEPLHMILNPDRETQKIRSYVAMYEQSGWMPSFALVFGDWPAMTGNHAATWMTDAWFKGLRGFDRRKAYEGLKKNSLQGTLLPWNNGPATSLDAFYNAKGYMPGLRAGEKETVKEVDPNWEKRQCVSVTLDNSYSDWCIAQLAAVDNNEADRRLFLQRARNYRNVFRTDKGFMWPKDADGKWIEPFDAKSAGREYFTENNAYTYNWDVKHDFAGLFELMGGRKAAEAKLDQLFREPLGAPKFKFWTTQPDSSGLVGQFVMGNEPSLHIPYLYNYLGAPWKTQKRVRMLLDTWFTDSLFGIPGDEDGGGMSAFVVFSMMGFFPVTPGIPVYTIGSPVFDEVDIRLPGGKTFTVKAPGNSAANKYIQSASLNGTPVTKPWFTHADLLNGGTLKLTLGSRPDKRWGSRLSDAPPSSMDYQPGRDAEK